MALALFDLDNTLLAGDSDYLWGQFLSERGIVDSIAHESENKRFYEQYREGCLDIDEFLRFQLKPLASHPRAQLEAWRKDYLREKIEPILLPKAVDLIEKHRRQGDELIIITATNRFITEPIASLYKIENLLATEPELVNGEYTGAVSGTPCFQGGKVERLQDWIEKSSHDLTGSWFYSDSHNDLPLLKQVDHPVAVDADDTLTRHAREHHWPIISLR